MNEQAREFQETSVAPTNAELMSIRAAEIDTLNKNNSKNYEFLEKFILFLCSAALCGSSVSELPKHCNLAVLSLGWACFLAALVITLNQTFVSIQLHEKRIDEINANPYLQTQPNNQRLQLWLKISAYLCITGLALLLVSIIVHGLE